MPFTLQFSLQVIEKVPHNKTRKMDAARALCSSSSSSRARLAKKLRINPVSYRAPTSSQASVTRGRQVMVDPASILLCYHGDEALGGPDQHVVNAGFNRKKCQRTCKLLSRASEESSGR